MEKLKMEKWRAVPGWEGFYQVSNLGRVKSLLRRDSIGRRVNEKILRVSTSSTGYLGCIFSKDNKEIHKRVHRLVMETFVPTNKKQDVIHIDGNFKNNRLKNLHWGKRSRNYIGIPKLSEKQVREIFNAKGSQRTIAKQFSVSPTSVYRIKNKKLLGHLTQKGL